MNYGFYISGNSTRLYKFLNSTSRETIDSIKIVVSDKNIPVSLCKLLDVFSIEYINVDHKSLGMNKQERNLKFSNILLDCLKVYEVDYLFSFGEHLLSGELLEKYKWHLINFHPSILPMYSGIGAIDQAVEHGNTLLVGITAHFIDEGTDTGPIIMQSVIPIKTFYNRGNDYDCVLDLIIPMLNILIKLLEEQKIIIKDGAAEIIGADYERTSLFPYVDGWNEYSTDHPLKVEEEGFM